MQLLDTTRGIVRATCPRAPTSSAIPRLGHLHARALHALGRTGEAAAVLDSSIASALEQQRTNTLRHLYATQARLCIARDDNAAAECALASARGIIDAVASDLHSASSAGAPAVAEQYVERATASLPEIPSLVHRASPKSAAAGLTPREREVAALVAQGQSNRAIAETLVLSERTAERHVANIMNKLGHSSRAQIAAWYVASQESSES